MAGLSGSGRNALGPRVALLIPHGTWVDQKCRATFCEASVDVMRREFGAIPSLISVNH